MGNERLKRLSRATSRRRQERFLYWVTLGVLLIWVGVAQAGTVYITFVSGSGVRQGNQQVGPYNLTVNGQAAKLVCDDIVHTVSPGQSWSAYMTTGLTDLSHVRWPGGLQAYGAAAWLTQYGMSHPAEWGNANFALWALFNPGPAKSDPGWTQAAQNLLTAATSQTYTADQFPGLQVYTPIDPTSPQEFVTIIPEPGSVLLLGGGLIGLMLFGRRRR